MRPLTALYITLTGADLAIIEDDLWRVVIVEASYDSVDYGNGLYVRSQYEFPIEDLADIESSGTLFPVVTDSLTVGESAASA